MPPELGVPAGVSWGLYFFAYNRAKERYQGVLEQSKLSPQLHLLSAAEAGALARPPSSPLPPRAAYPPLPVSMLSPKTLQKSPYAVSLENSAPEHQLVPKS